MLTLPSCINPASRNLYPGVYESQAEFWGKCDAHFCVSKGKWHTRKETDLPGCRIGRFTVGLMLYEGERRRWWDTIRSNGVKDGVDLDNGAGSGAVLRAQWFRATSPKVVSSSPGKILMLNCSRNVVSWLTTYLDSQLIPTAWQANKDFIFCQQNSTVLPTITRFFFFKSLKNDCSYW